MSEQPMTRQALARRAWRVMFDLLMRSAPQRAERLARRGLTPNDSRALFSLDLQGRAMRALADAWECDPSNATWIVDRLEKLGLAERRAIPDDRRVKLVALTAEGQRARAELLRDFHRPPPELAALAREDLEALHRALQKVAPAPSDESAPRRRARTAVSARGSARRRARRR